MSRQQTLNNETDLDIISVTQWNFSKVHSAVVDTSTQYLHKGGNRQIGNDGVHLFLLQIECLPDQVED